MIPWVVFAGPMIKRIIDISQGPTYLSIENDQLVLQRERVEIARIPAEDVGILLVEHRATVYTHAALVRLIAHGAAVVLCDEKHLPAGLLLPMTDNRLHTRRLAAQVAAKEPLKKQLWRQLVQRKIRGQAGNLAEEHPVRGQMLDMAESVRSGDVGNAEGLAARFYWQAYFGEDFRRDPEGEPPNGLLNYGYMVFRAAVARAIVASGLHPALGLHHHNRENAFCLADDLVEVFRPMVDACVLGLAKGGHAVVDREAKEAVLGLLSREIRVGGSAGPLMVALGRMTTSLVECYAGKGKRMELPDL